MVTRRPTGDRTELARIFAHSTKLLAEGMQDFTRSRPDEDARMWQQIRLEYAEVTAELRRQSGEIE